jgi:hypothetical protein
MTKATLPTTGATMLSKVTREIVFPFPKASEDTTDVDDGTFVAVVINVDLSAFLGIFVTGPEADADTIQDDDASRVFQVLLCGLEVEVVGVVVVEVYVLSVVYVVDVVLVVVVLVVVLVVALVVMDEVRHDEELGKLDAEVGDCHKPDGLVA